jgi:hypothetical protein
MQRFALVHYYYTFDGYVAGKKLKTKTIQNCHLQGDYFGSLRHARGLEQEILLLLLSPAAGLFLREEEHAQVMIKLLKEAVRRHGIRVRILTSKDTQEQIEKLIAREESRRRERARQRSIRNRTRKIPNSFTTTTTFTN